MDWRLKRAFKEIAEVASLNLPHVKSRWVERRITTWKWVKNWPERTRIGYFDHLKGHWESAWTSLKHAISNLAHGLFFPFECKGHHH